VRVAWRQVPSGAAHDTRGNPGWAPYDVASRTTGLLTQTITPVDDPAGDERALWAGIR
jgi:para-nitrobenzyl esterase